MLQKAKEEAIQANSDFEVADIKLGVEQQKLDDAKAAASKALQEYNNYVDSKTVENARKAKDDAAAAFGVPISSWLDNTSGAATEGEITTSAADSNRAAIFGAEGTEGAADTGYVKLLKDYNAAVQALDATNGYTATNKVAYDKAVDELVKAGIPNSALGLKGNDGKYVQFDVANRNNLPAAVTNVITAKENDFDAKVDAYNNAVKAEKAANQNKTNLENAKNNTQGIVDALLDDTNKSENSFSTEQILSSLYSLRTDEISFKDDGVYRALELADILKENGESLSSVLEKACRWVPEAPLDFLEELDEYKELLIDEYLPAIDFRVSKENLAINQILDEVTERIKNNPLDPAEKKNAVLSNFISELRTNPEGVWNTLLEYNPVFAATVQQVEGSEISRARKGMELDTIETGETPYEYVIVDEAARVAPPDLMIPLAKGKHIILVGDQRQLPQQVDQQI